MLFLKPRFLLNFLQHFPELIFITNSITKRSCLFHANKTFEKVYGVFSKPFFKLSGRRDGVWF